MKVLVTGATGFIGGRLVRRLARDGHEIRCLVRPTSQVEVLEELGTELVTGDVRDLDTVRRAVHECEIVYHLAAIANPSAVTPYTVYETVNVQGSKNMLEAAVDSPKLQQMVVASSIAATGPSRDGKPLTEASPRRPITNYGRSKVVVEDLCQEYHREKSLPVVVVRPPMVYGIGDRDWLGLFRMIGSGGMPLLGVPLPGDHENLLDFCYVDNLVEGLILAATRERAIGQVYFLSDERPYRIREIIEAVAEALGASAPMRFWPLWLAKSLASALDAIGFVIRQDMPLDRRTVRWMTTSYWVCDVSKARAELGYAPSISLAQATKQTVDWARSEGLIASA
jgi:nucleoside-diphosphate-sugar epimerase